MKQVLVVGAGMVGVSCAWALRERGCAVTLVDPLGAGRGTSHGNAGVLSPTSLIPFNHPGLWRQLPQLWRGTAGFDIPRSVLWRRAPELLAFLRHARPSHTQRTIGALHTLIGHSRGLHERWLAQAGAQRHWRETGWLWLYRQPQAWQQSAWQRAQYAAHGLDTQALDAAELRALEPGLAPIYTQALWVRGAASVDDPQALVQAYAQHLAQHGVVLHPARVTQLRAQGAHDWRVQISDGQCLQAQDVVLATGPWSRQFLHDQWGWRLPMLHERGYHMHYQPQADRPALGRPVYDTAAGAVVSPMARGLRLSTGVELGDAQDAPRTRMLDRAEALAREGLPLGARCDEAAWLGARPSLPDSRPMLGRAPGEPGRQGLWLALGHQHIGLSTGPASGELLAQLLLGQTPFMDPSPWAPGRFLR